MDWILKHIPIAKRSIPYNSKVSYYLVEHKDKSNLNIDGNYYFTTCMYPSKISNIPRTLYTRKLADTPVNKEPQVIAERRKINFWLA